MWWFFVLWKIANEMQLQDFILNVLYFVYLETLASDSVHDLIPYYWVVLVIAVFTVAFFYSSVGHGGATGYLAAITFVGFSATSARTAVLIANVFVASIAFWRFYKAKHFDWKVFFSFAASSVPCAYLGSKIHISPQSYKIVLGLVLTAAGLSLLFRARWQEDLILRKCFLWAALLVGAVLGFLAGITGIGGGVFLSPVLYLFRWVKPKTTGGIAAAFIVANSIAGLAGVGRTGIMHAGVLLWLTLPAVIGAILGTYYGARRWSSATFSRVLAAVLIFAGGKLLLEARTGNSHRPRASLNYYRQIQEG